MTSSNQIQSDEKLEFIQRHVIVIAFLTLALSIGACWWFYCSYSKLEKYKIRAHVAWLNEENIKVKQGPSWFMYDSSKLYSLKQISNEEKTMLLNLIDSDTSANKYYKAIERLSFLSNMSEKVPETLLFLIGGIAAILGVQIRTIFDLIGNVCYKRHLNMLRWWPWYALRPLLGFLVGAFIVVLLQSKIFVPTENDGLQNIYLVGLTVLAGFGVTDVIGMLRSLSKKLFGSDRYDNDSNPRTTSTTI